MNKKTYLALAVCLSMAGAAGAQQRDGGISSDMLRSMQQAHAAVPSAKAIFNAMASNKIDDIAVNFANQGAIDTYFSDETPKQSIHDQQSSGRCWMFSGFNVLRADFAKRHADSLAVEFSHNYLFFYDQLEKANLMLQGVIDHAGEPMDSERVRFFFKNPLNTSKMSSLLSSKLREFGLELRKMVADGKKNDAIKARKTEMLSTIYNMLCLTLGEPVKEFTYTFKTKDGKPVGQPRKYTPKEFYEATVGGPVSGSFIMVMNDPRREYYKTYEVEYDRHTYDGQNWKYLNLPMDDIERLAIASIKDGRKMYSSYDVGKQLDRKRGYLDTENYDYGSLLGTTFGMDKAERISTYDSGSTHAMTLTAVDLDENGKAKKWKVENSWGASYGQAGCLIMSDRWFREYMFRLVVDKKYVPAGMLKQYEQKPVMVMPEDPLFSTDD